VWQVEFVRVLLQHGVCMRTYLTVSRLRALYQHVDHSMHQNDQHASKLLLDASHGRQHFYLYDVKNLLERLLENSYEQIYALDEPPDDGDSLVKKVWGWHHTVY
jgi:hypothetical protein